jgi:hypothetical protein
VLKGGVSGEDAVVWLYNSCGDLWGRVDSKLKLGLLAVVDRQTLHHQRCEARAGTTTEAVEDEETLKTGALVSQLASPVKHKINELFSDGVVTSGVVVGGILFACDELLRVEELAVGSSSDLI